MGIPAYFSQIIKNYPNIFVELNNIDFIIDNLYLDSNGIIYDSINFCKDSNDFENSLCIKVCEQITNYINLFKPKKKIIIAFDGVPPVAKLEQQRNRRYKTWYINNHLLEKECNWDTSSITPGTEFMKKLSLKINSYFKYKYENIEVLIYDSYVKGEGEHKIFQYIRNNKSYHKTSNSLIYGLDADLIMLSLIHLKISTNIFLYRETPHYAQNIHSKMSIDKNYLIDIYELAKGINLKLSGNEMIDCIDDYIFICFFLGNDFMPHFPHLNIRTNGIDILIDFYKQFKKGKIILDNKINWKSLKNIIKELAKFEQKLFIEEHDKRNKLSNNLKKKNLEGEMLIQSKPIFERSIENFINPNEEFWQNRYYSELFKIDIDEVRKQQICINYLEGLEWNYKYYTEDCFDWFWNYKYNYPPLLQDLYQFIPDFETQFIEEPNYNVIKPITQLAYVLPRNSLNLLPINLFKKLIEKKPNWYTLDINLEWSYCRYLWECHVILPEINIFELNKLIDSI